MTVGAPFTPAAADALIGLVNEHLKKPAIDGKVTGVEPVQAPGPDPDKLYRITVKDGDKEAKYLVTVFDSASPDLQKTRPSDFQQACGELGVLVPHVVDDLEYYGRTVRIAFEASGAPLKSINKDQAHEIGVLLAMIHTSTPPKGDVGAHTATRPSPWAGSRLAERVKQLPQGMTHGDIKPGSFLFNKEGQVSGVLGLESAREGLFANDIAKAILAFGLTAQNGGSKSYKVNKPNIFALISGYDSVRKMDKAEYQCLPEMIKKLTEPCLVESGLVEAIGLPRDPLPMHRAPASGEQERVV